MRSKRLCVFLTLTAMLMTAAAVHADLDLSADEVKHRLQHRLDERHFTAKIRFAIEIPGFNEHRELEIWRDDVAGERERLMARFEAPADMRGIGLLYIEGRDTPNSYFIYQPNIRRVRRIPESLVSQDVYGVDLEYMGFGIAQLQPVEVESMEVDTIGDRRVYRLTEKALHAGSQRFDRRTIWIDPETFIPIRTEHYRDGVTTLIARTLKVVELGGVPTPTETIYELPIAETVVRLTVTEVDYESPIPEAFFSTLLLTKTH